MFAHALTIDAVISFLFELALAGIIIYAIYWFLNKINLDPGIKNIILFIIGLIALAFLLNITGIWHGTL